VLKALGTGWRQGLSFTDIEMKPDETGTARVQLRGLARDRADQLRITTWHLSMAHCRAYATANVIAVQFKDGVSLEAGSAALKAQVANIDTADLKTAYEAIPGYAAQQNTLNTQSGFTLLIGILVIGGFFQIQLLQKVPQIGVLKAIGTSNAVVAGSVVLQIILVSTFGVLLGGAVTLLLAAFIPGTVPVVFAGGNVALAIILLLLIGPVGGLVSVRLAINVEPLIALGLSS
jgi:putative ABC transport system permease protein